MIKYLKSIIYLLFISISVGNSFPSGISIHRLNNGMDIVLIENRSLPMVGANMVVKTGSAYETNATSGMSHMLEHLLFNGTTSRTQKELYDDADRIGGYNNANTGEYYTNFMMVTPAEHIRAGMAIQADMLFRSILPEEKYEKEKGIVLEEIAQSLSRPETQIERDIQSILYQGHSLSLPTLGTYSTIQSLPLEQVRQFYKENYVPNNMILSVIGNFNSTEMLDWIKDIYGKPGPGRVLRPKDADFKTGFDTPDFTTGELYHRSHSDSTTLIHLAFVLPNNPVPGFFDLMEEVLSSKIENLQTDAKKRFGTNIKSIYPDIRLSPVGNFLILKVTVESDDNLDMIVSFLSNAVHGLKFSMKKESVTAFATAEKTAFYKSLEKPHMFGIYNAHIFAQKGIDGFLSSFNSKLYQKASDSLKIFKIPNNPTVIIHHPMDSSERETNSLTTPQLFDYDGTGTTLIVKQNSASPLLAIHYLFKHKARLEKEFGKDAAKVLHDCFDQRMKSGNAKKKSARFGLSFKVNDNPFIPMDDIYLHDDFGYIRVEGLADDFKGVIDFLNSSFTDFIPTRDEFTKATSSSHGSLGRMTRKNKAKEKFNKLVDKQIYEKNESESVQPELTYESLLAFAKSYWTPENLILSVVSPENHESVQTMFADFGYSRNIDSEPAYVNIYQLNSESISIEENGGGAQSYLFWGFIKEINPADKPALTALSLILSNKIVFDIREKQGMAYRMHAGISVKKNKALFSINFGTRPENVDGLISQFPGFFSIDMLTNVDEVTLEKSVNMYLGRMMFRRLSSINQAYYLGYSQYYENDLNADAQFLDSIKTVTLDDINRVAKKYMIVKNPVSIIVR